MESQYSRERSAIFATAIKVMPEAERLCMRGERLFVEDVKGNTLAEVLDGGEFLFNQGRAA